MELLRVLKEKNKFTERECVIADYILNNCEAILPMTTRELAQHTYTSATVIVRFVKKIGYLGFSDFKIHLLTDLKDNRFHEVEVEKKENIISIVNKVSSLHEEILLDTKRHLSIEVLENIQRALEQVKQVDIFAMDANAAIGEYATHNIMQAGKVSNVYASIDKILLYESLVKDSVVIVISRMGNDKHMVKAIRNLRKKKHFVIAITANVESLLAKNSDASLLCMYKENIVALGDSIFHISVSYLFDILTAIIIKNNYEEALDLYHLHDQLYKG